VRPCEAETTALRAAILRDLQRDLVIEVSANRGHAVAPFFN
jgi:hypothetical protein